MRKKDVNADKTISKIITTLLHPLNYKADETKAENIANTIKGYLKYCDFSVKKRNNTYEVLSYKELEKEEKSYSEFVEGAFEDVERGTLDDGDEDDILRQIDDAKLREEKSKIRSIRDNHQAYMDVVEIFCSNPKKPTKELNDAYLFLSKKIQKDIKYLKLEHYTLSFYKPFKEDLYRAEIEWNGDGYLDSLRLNPKLSWDAVRPSLYRVHSEITNLCNIADEDTEMTDDEKRLEKITSLISQQRNKEASLVKEKVEKLEVLHKYEKAEEKPKIKLSDFQVSFDNETAQLKVSDFCVVDFPAHKNEHYLLRSVFSVRKNETVDWQTIYEAINNTKSETLNKKEIEKQKKSVNDTVRSINKKVKEVCNTDSNLLLWETKCVKRLH